MFFDASRRCPSVATYTMSYSWPPASCVATVDTYSPQLGAATPFALIDTPGLVSLNAENRASHAACWFTSP